MAPHPSFGHPLPKGRGKSYYFQSRLLANNCNILLAPWGEDARRAGEGLFF